MAAAFRSWLLVALSLAAGAAAHTRPGGPVVASRGAACRPTLRASAAPARGAPVGTRAPPRRACASALALPAVPTLAQLHAMSSSIQPWQYFCYLMLAGLGVPLSEDGLGLLAGSVLGSLEPARRARTVAALYLGVVLSDVETFLIGALLVSRVGRALRRRPPAATTAAAAGACAPPPQPLGGAAGAKAMRLVADSGAYVGFVARFCVGLRAPIALTCGVLPGVPLGRFAAGAALGALVTVPAQLALGAALRERVTSAVGLASLCASFYAAGPVSFAVASAVLYALGARGAPERGSAPDREG
ncbi:hypothetical protein KFE25_002314 [Diacronema lutheri]|uniref:GDT1 family protein n=2 Tax=Diacronema lutheri TaxID=2081491 RepID=A0A8J5X791_DIALT|nr:hypothetical protein KFE25_002314 [Diacronema lutheri]